MTAQISTAEAPEPYRMPFSEVELREMPEPAPEPEFNPLQALGRLMRGRWLMLLLICGLVAGGAGFVGFSSGNAVYEGHSIIRISAREPSILFANSNDSRLKWFQAFVKSETTYVASHLVMQRAAQIVSTDPRVNGEPVTAKGISDSVRIDRKDALVVITAVSVDPALAAIKANAVIDAYLALSADRERDLLAKLERINAEMLEVGGEFGNASLVKAHIAKVAQLEALLARRAEVEATLEAMRAKTDLAGADMGDVEIKRATLLDRGLADLTFDKAKREAELVALLRRYVDGSPKVVEKRHEIEIIDAAIKARREQIAVLGRTGALTDAETSTEEETTAEIEALLEKVNGQIAAAREDAKALNSKRLSLDFLPEERDETRRMLDKTRRALDAVRLESRNSLPGMIEVLTPAITADAPAKDKRKVFGLAGFAGGGFAAMAIFMFVAASRGQIRFSDDLWRLTARMPLLRVIPGGRRRKRLSGPRRDVDHLCNAIQLLPDHGHAANGKARVIAVGGADGADATELAQELGDSFARRAIPTLLVDADLVTGALTEALGLAGHAGHAGWREMLADEPAPTLDHAREGLVAVGAGVHESVSDKTISAKSVHDVLHAAGHDFGVVVIHVGAPGDRLSASLIAAASDLVISVVRPGDRIEQIERHLRRADELAQSGAAIVYCNAAARDPGYTH